MTEEEFRFDFRPKMWSGWPTFLMIFVDQKLIGGRKDLLALLSEDKTLGASQ